MSKYPLFLACMLLVTPTSFAGIYIIGEKLEPQGTSAKLESFVGQLKFLRSYGPTDVSIGTQSTEHRKDFLAKVEKLRAQGRLSPDDQANLGGYLLYLKQTSPRQAPFEEAVSVLESGYRSNPRHFALAANLGTAYQLTGRLDAAERCLEAAVELADALQKPVEQLHLTLIRRRLHESTGRTQPDLDHLFGRPAAPFRFIYAQGAWGIGPLAPAEIAKLPGQSVEQAVSQLLQLLVWLPDDGRLHWQLGEWALVLGQRNIALDLLDQSVNTFRLSHPTLKQHRAGLQELVHWQTYRERLAPKGPPEAWLVSTLGQSLTSLSTPATLGTAANWLVSVVPPRKSAADAFMNSSSDLGSAGALAEGKPFVMQPWHWGLIAIGAALASLLLIWQAQQLFRKRQPA